MAKMLGSRGREHWHCTQAPIPKRVIRSREDRDWRAEWQELDTQEEAADA